MKSYTLLFVLLVFVAMATAQRKPVDCTYTKPNCICPYLWDPVCATNGCTYGNRCVMGCADAKFAYNGECKSC